MRLTDSIYVAGDTGLIGSAVKRRLSLLGYSNLLTISHGDLDLTDPTAVEHFFRDTNPQYVILAAGRVGGIVENSAYPADFITSNIGIQLNVLQSAARSGVERLITYGSSCMYPRECPQPMGENQLLSGHPEPTSIAYAIAKLAGVHMCLAYNKQFGMQKFIPVIPNSAYGPNDNFDEKSGHVLSGLLARFHKAASEGSDEVVIWGTGNPRREFVHCDDIADASIHLLQADLDNAILPINVGVGADYSITELAQHVADVVGFKGRITHDLDKPDGAPKKLLDSSRLNNLGWSPKVEFFEGLRMTYEWYLENGN